VSGRATSAAEAFLVELRAWLRCDMHAYEPIDAAFGAISSKARIPAKVAQETGAMTEYAPPIVTVGDAARAVLAHTQWAVDEAMLATIEVRSPLAATVSESRHACTNYEALLEEHYTPRGKATIKGRVMGALVALRPEWEEPAREQIERWVQGGVTVDVFDAFAAELAARSMRVAS
jgi:hypothetical protein